MNLRMQSSIAILCAFRTIAAVFVSLVPVTISAQEQNAETPPRFETPSFNLDLTVGIALEVQDGEEVLVLSYPDYQFVPQVEVGEVEVPVTETIVEEQVVDGETVEVAKSVERTILETRETIYYTLHADKVKKESIPFDSLQFYNIDGERIPDEQIRSQLSKSQLAICWMVTPPRPGQTPARGFYKSLFRENLWFLTGTVENPLSLDLLDVLYEGPPFDEPAADDNPPAPEPYVADA